MEGTRGAGLGELEARPLGGSLGRGRIISFFVFVFFVASDARLGGFSSACNCVLTCWHPWPSTIGSMVSGLCRCCTVADSMS